LARGRFLAVPASAQLYDLDFDLKQTRNLYREYPEVVEELSALLKKHSAPKIRNPAPVKSGKKYDGFKPLGNLRFRFESGDLDGWSIIEGTAGRPILDHKSLPKWKSKPFNHEGKSHLSTVAATDGFTDQQKVVIQSPKFVIQSDRGSYDPDTLYVGLFDAETKKLLLTGGGSRGPQIKRTTWEVSKLKGKTVYLQVVDRKSSGWAHLTFDDFSIAGKVQLTRSPSLPIMLRLQAISPVEVTSL
jgi:hypothetical protein